MSAGRLPHPHQPGAEAAESNPVLGVPRVYHRHPRLPLAGVRVGAAHPTRRHLQVTRRLPRQGGATVPERCVVLHLDILVLGPILGHLLASPIHGPGHQSSESPGVRRLLGASCCSAAAALYLSAAQHVREQPHGGAAVGGVRCGLHPRDLRHPRVVPAGGA